MQRIVLVQIDPWSDPIELLAVTPIGRVPALVTDDGAVITDSTTICEYFDAVGPGPMLMEGDRFEVMARAALAQGLIDAAFAAVVELRRPAELRWESWVSRQHRAIARTLEMLAPAGDRFDLGDITLASALGDAGHEAVSVIAVGVDHAPPSPGAEAWMARAWTPF